MNYKLGTEFVVNARTEGEQTNVDLESFADGTFIMVWQSTKPSAKVMAQRFTADGKKKYR